MLLKHDNIIIIIITNLKKNKQKCVQFYMLSLITYKCFYLNTPLLCVSSIILSIFAKIATEAKKG